MARPDREKTEQERHPERYFVSPIGHPRDRVILHESAEATKGGRFISLNGFSFWAQSGVELDLPRPVRLMLDTLIKTETITHDDGTGRLVSESRNIPRFTYTLIKEDIENIPEPEVIAAGVSESTGASA